MIFTALSILAWIAFLTDSPNFLDVIVAVAMILLGVGILAYTASRVVSVQVTKGDSFQAEEMRKIVENTYIKSKTDLFYEYTLLAEIITPMIFAFSVGVMVEFKVTILFTILIAGNDISRRFYLKTAKKIAEEKRNA